MIRLLVILCALCASAVNAQIDRAMMSVEFVRPGIISEVGVLEASGQIPMGTVSGLVALSTSYLATGGAAQIAQTTFTPTIQTGRSFSIGGWIKTSATNDASLMGGNMGSPGALIDLAAYSASFTGAYFSVRDDDSSSADTCAAQVDVRDGQWHQIMGVFDASAATISLYVDGLYRSSATITVNSSGLKTFITPIGLLAVSRSSGAPLRTIRGEGRDFPFFSKALSAAEVAEVFSARK